MSSYCQNETDPLYLKRCKNQCNECLFFFGESWDLKEESKHEDD